LQESLEQLTNPSDEYLKLAKLNAAIYLFVADKAQSIDAGFEMLNG
jgi:anthranilate phosphoribosyltransferase